MSDWQEVLANQWLRERAAEIKNLASDLRGAVGAGDLSIIIPDAVHDHLAAHYPEREYSFDRLSELEEDLPPERKGIQYPQQLANGDFLYSEGLSKLKGRAMLCTRAGGDRVTFQETPESSFCLIWITSTDLTFRLLGAEEVLPAPGFVFNLLAHSQADNIETAILHTHAAGLVTLGRHPRAGNERAFNSALREEADQMRLQDKSLPDKVSSNKVAVLPFLIPGSREQWYQTKSALSSHRTILWKFHGIFIAGATIRECGNRLGWLESCAAGAFRNLPPAVPEAIPPSGELAIRHWGHVIKARVDLSTELAMARDTIVENPDDMEARRHFAGILREMGSPEHADFIERQLRPEVTKLDLHEERALRKDIDNQRKHHLDWSGFEAMNVPDGVTWEYRRGFVEHVICPSQQSALILCFFKLAPVVHVSLRKDTQPLVSLPERFAGLRSLALDGCGVGDRFVVDVLCAAIWPDLVWLSLSYNEITQEGVRALAAATATMFPSLRFIDLRGCKSDPRERVAFDHNVLTGFWLPEEGAQLEQEYGCIAWLHLTDDGKLRDTNRYRLAEMRSRAPVLS